MPNEWQSLKKNHTVDLKIDKTRLPYMVQALNTTIEKVLFFAKLKNNPSSFEITVDVTFPRVTGTTIQPTPLSLVDELKLWRGEKLDIILDKAFMLSVESNQLSNLDELVMVVKYVI